MKRKQILFLLGWSCIAGMSAQSVTLADCKRMARDNYPLVRQYGLVEQTRDLSLENAAKGWLPQLSVAAGGYAFTNILKESPQRSQMGMDLDNYVANASVTLRQNIYDGGQIKALERVTTAQSEVQQRQLDVNMYVVNERVEQLYFGILLIDEQMQQTDLLQQNLQVSLQTIESLMKGGLANQSDRDAVRVEQLKAIQQQETLKAQRKAYMNMLSAFTGKDWTEATILEKPSMPMATPTDQPTSTRPELSFYESQNLLVQAQRKQLDTKLRPTIGLFGTALWHSRITDMAHQGLVAGGISLSWNIGALYTRKNDLHKLSLQQSINDNQRNTFLFNNGLQNKEAHGTLNAMQKQLEQDDEIIRLRESIEQASKKKVEAGTESVNEWIRNIHAASLTRTQKALHEIQLLQAAYRLKNITNE